MADVSASGQILSPKLATRLGTAFIVVALALPFLGAFAGHISLATASYDAAKYLGLLLCTGLLIWMATRHRSSALRAYGYLLAGLALCVFSGIHRIQPIREGDAVKRFVIASVA